MPVVDRLVEAAVAAELVVFAVGEHMSQEGVQSGAETDGD